MNKQFIPLENIQIEPELCQESLLLDQYSECLSSNKLVTPPRPFRCKGLLMFILTIIALLSPLHCLFASSLDSSYTVNVIYENMPLVFIAKVISTDSMYVQVNPIEVYRGNLSLQDSMILTVPYSISYHGDYRETHYSNPFMEGSDYLFFVEDQQISFYGSIGDGFYMLYMLGGLNIGDGWISNISPDLLTEDDFQRVIEGQYPVEDYTLEGYVDLPVLNESFYLILIEHEEHFRAYSDVSAINELIARVSVDTQRPFRRNYSYGRNSNTVRIVLNPLGITSRCRYKKISFYGDLIRYRDGAMYFRAQPVLPFISDLKEMVHWINTWRMPSTLMALDLKLDSIIEGLDKEVQVLIRVNSEGIEASIDSIEARSYCSAGHDWWDNILGRDTLALILAPNEDAQELYGYFVLEMSYIPIDFQGYFLYNLFTMINQADSVSGKLHRMEHRDSEPVHVGSYSAYLVDEYSQTFLWNHEVSIKLPFIAHHGPIQEAPALICVTDSNVSVNLHFSEPIFTDKAVLDFISIDDDEYIISPSKMTWFTTADSLNPMWCCSLLYDRNSFEDGNYILEYRIEDNEGNNCCMNSDFFPRLRLGDQPRGDTVIVDVRFAAEIDRERTRISFLLNSPTTEMYQPFRKELLGYSIERLNGSTYNFNDRIRAYFLLDSLSVSNPRLWIQPISKWGTALKQFFVVYVQLDNCPVIPELHYGTPKEN